MPVVTILRIKRTHFFNFQWLIWHRSYFAKEIVNYLCNCSIKFKQEPCGLVCYWYTELHYSLRSRPYLLGIGYCANGSVFLLLSKRTAKLKLFRKLSWKLSRKLNRKLTESQHRHSPISSSFLNENAWNLSILLTGISADNFITRVCSMISALF